MFMLYRIDCAMQKYTDSGWLYKIVDSNQYNATWCLWLNSFRVTFGHVYDFSNWLCNANVYKQVDDYAKS